MSKVTLQTISDWLNGKGIMSVLTDNFDVPWANVINGQVLDDDYYGNRSGNKIVSPLTEKFLTTTGVTDANMLRLARVIYSKYGYSWQKAFSALYAEYNPIENYNMTETETPAKMRETTTPAETTQTTTLSEHTEKETKQDKNVNAVNGGKVITDETTFPNPRKSTTTEVGEKTDELTYPTTRTSSKGVSGGYTDTHTGNNYTKETKEFNRHFEEGKINSFNDGLVPTGQHRSGTGSDGNDGWGGSVGEGYGIGTANGSKTTESGNFTDGREYNTYNETVTESGSEKHTVDVTGLNGSGKYTTETTESGSEKTEHKEKDYSKWETETVYTQQSPETIKHTTDSNEVKETEALTDRELTRTGNIGVTTSQQMIESEVLLRMQYTLMDTIVFPNVDSVMCLNIFGCEELTYDDFTIITNYVLPIATASKLGGVKIGNGISISSDGTISAETGYITQEQLNQAISNFITNTDLQTALADYVTSSALTTALNNYVTNTTFITTLNDYVTNSNLALMLQAYATMNDLSNGLSLKQNTLVSGENIKTINGISLLGSGDIVIEGNASTIESAISVSNSAGSVSDNIELEVVKNGN